MFALQWRGSRIPAVPRRGMTVWLGLLASIASASIVIAEPLQLTLIPSNFNTARWLQRAAIPGPSPSEGAFRFICNASHNLPDDPIVYPGQPGRSHMHTFFGNRLANAHSTYESLRTTGASTCQGGPLNRSAYWAPSMMNGHGKIVMPDYAVVYYKYDPRLGPLTKLPRGLRMIFGYDFDKVGGEPHIYWTCDTPGAGTYRTLTQAVNAGCPAGARIGVVAFSPDCWDGKNLDSPDHRSHLAYARHKSEGPRCPLSHPRVLPQFTLGLWYSHNGFGELAKWHLSSDRMPGMPERTPGFTFHTDWIGAWDDVIMETWIRFCLRNLKSCSAADYGNGTAGIAPRTFEWVANPRLVSPPRQPDTVRPFAPANHTNHGAHH